MLEEKEKAAQKEKDLQERDHGPFLEVWFNVFCCQHFVVEVCVNGRFCMS